MGEPVAKDETSRGEELGGLGWTPEEVRQYEELWEYRQRWGAINLEAEDRVFLRRAEAALPKRVAHGKSSLKKSLQQKSHYRWLCLYRDAMLAATDSLGLQPGEEAAWVILLEAELRALDHYEPVLGLPITIASGLAAICCSEKPRPTTNRPEIIRLNDPLLAAG